MPLLKFEVQKYYGKELSENRDKKRSVKLVGFPFNRGFFGAFPFLTAYKAVLEKKLRRFYYLLNGRYFIY